MSTLLPTAAWAQKDRTGEWGPVIAWPHIPVAVGQLADGRVVTWASTRPTTFPAGESLTYAAIFDPATGSISALNNLRHDMFCSGIATTADGRILAAGGGATVRTTSTIGMNSLWGQNWVPTGDMSQGRWYNTSIALPNGRILTWWGRGANGMAEIWDPVSGAWTQNANLNALSAADPEDGVEDENQLYPYLHVIPDGRIFNAGPLKSMYYLDWRGAGSMQAAGTRAPDGNRHRKLGFAVMYRPGKILYTGGRDDRYSPSVTNTAVHIDVTGASPVVTPAANMNYSRAFHYKVLLPNGEVMAVGGNTSGVKFSDNGAVLMPEVWNPDSNIWRTVAPMTEPRGYHSTALLLRDGRVMAAGGGLCGCEADHLNAQIYTPWYLFNADGSPASRPSIFNAATNLKAGQTFQLQGSDDIAGFNMVRLQGTTHGMNTDQRLVPITFTRTSAGNYSLTMNANPNILIPGLYWIFALKANGTPSIGYPVQVFTAETWPGEGGVTVNLARGKSATQSSQWGDGAAARAVDGNQNGDWSGNSLNHTYNDGQPWWEVDLGAPLQISDVRIWNRTDCCGDRLANFHVFVSNEPFVGNSVNQSQNQTGVLDLHHPGVAGRTTTFPVGRTGRYVRVQLTNNNFLHLAEVEVLSGSAVVSPPPPPPNAAPVVAIVSPANNAVLTAPAAVDITATASDPDGNLARVEFYNGATKVGEDATAPFQFTFPSLTAGTYALTAKAVDAAGLSATAVVNVTVNAPAPPPTVAASNLAVGKYAVQSSQWGPGAAARAIDGNTNGDWSGNSLNHTFNDPQPWWQVDIGETAAITEIRVWNRTDCCAERLANFHVLVSNDPIIGHSLSQAQANPGILDLYYPGVAGRTTVFPVGRTGRYVRVQLAASSYLHLAEVEVITGQPSAPVNQAPLVSIVSPANNATYPAPANITVNVNAADPDNNLARVEFYNGAAKIGEDTAAPYSFNWTNVAPGAYTLTARAIDTAGLTSSASVNLTVSTPAPVNAAPTVSLWAPANNASYTAPASIQIGANAGDPDNNLARVEFYAGAVKLGEDTTAPYAFTWTAAPAGSHTITARAVDSAGLSASASVNVVVNAVLPPSGAPVVSFVWPANHSTYTAPATVTFGVNATDPDNNLTRVQIFNGSALIADFNAAPYNFTWNSVGQGSYTITAKATDATGLTATANIQVTVAASADVIAPIVSSLTGKCLQADQSALVQQPCNGSAAQRFRFRAVSGLDNMYTIVSEQTNLCLDMNYNTADNAPVVLAACSGHTGQRFRADKFPNGLHRLLSALSIKALRVKDGSTASGAPVVQFTWGGVGSQYWQIAGLP